MIDTNKLIPQRKSEERLSDKTITTIGLIKKDVVKIDSLLKEKLVISKVRYSILRKQNERDRRSKREGILERKKSRPQDYDIKSNKRGKGFGGILGGILKALLAGIGFTIFKSLPTLLRIGKVIKTIAAPLILGATVFLGAIARIASTGLQILPDVKGKNFKDASARSINSGIENFKGALIGAAVAFAGGALGGALTSRLVRGRTFTEREAIQELGRVRSATERAKMRRADNFTRYVSRGAGIPFADAKQMIKDGTMVEMIDDVQELKKGRTIKKKFSTIKTFDELADYYDAEDALKLERLEREAGSDLATRRAVEQQSGTKIRDFTPRKVPISKKMGAGIDPKILKQMGLDSSIAEFGTQVPGAMRTRPTPLNKGIYGSPEVDQFFNEITNNKKFNNNPALRTKVDNDFQLFLNARNPSVKSRRLSQLLNSLKSGGVSTLNINRLSTILTFSAFKPIDPTSIRKPANQIFGAFGVKGGQIGPKTAADLRFSQRFGKATATGADPFTGAPTYQVGSRGRDVDPVTGMFRAKRAAVTKKGLSKLLFNVGGEAFEQSVKQTIKASIGTVPIIGDLLGFLLDVFLFGQPVGRAAFMALGSFVGSLIGGVFGLIGGPPGALVGGILGGIGGDLLGGAFYDLIFRDNAVGRIADNISQSFVKKGVKTGIGAGFMSGGFAPYGGRVHAGEFVIDADSTRAIERKSPGFLMALNKARGSQVDEVLETYMSYGNEGEGSERLIPLPFEKVVTRTVLVENDGEDTSSSPFMDLYRRG